MLRSRRCSPMRARICACTVTSRAVVGSSANSSFGPQARAMAIITRWRMPPDSSCGYWRTRRAGVGDAHVGEQLARRSPRRRRGTCRGALAAVRRSGRRRASAGSASPSGPGRPSPSSVPHSSRSSPSVRPTSSSPSKRTEPRAHDLGPGQQAHDRTAEHGLARARTRRRCRPPRRARTVRDTPSTARTTPRGGAEVGDEVGRPRAADALAHQIAARRMSKRRASQSPMRLNESTVRNSIRHGKTVAHQPSRHGVAVLVDQLAPRRRRRLDAEAEERQRPSAATRMPSPVKATVSIVGTRLGSTSRPMTRPARRAEAARREHVVAPRAAPACAPARCARAGRWRGCRG